MLTVCIAIKYVSFAEKGVSVDIHLAEKDNLPEALHEINPYGTVPTLIDRELGLYQANIIMEYLMNVSLILH